MAPLAQMLVLPREQEPEQNFFKLVYSSSTSWLSTGLTYCGDPAAVTQMKHRRTQRSPYNHELLCDKITTNLFSINNATNTLERSLKQVGTTTDNQQLRDRISQINSSAGAAVQEITGLLRTLQPLAQGDRQRRVQADRLHNEFQASASRFAEVQKKVVSTLRTARLPADMVAVEQDNTSATDSMIATEQQSLAKIKQLEDMEFEAAMNQEREQRVQRLESDIIDINEIMRDLSSIVTAQGEITQLKIMWNLLLETWRRAERSSSRLPDTRTRVGERCASASLFWS
ncbi:syntaxin-7-like isoform X2 [Portunus trituberculatus]|uniref:syntaxin-7-like isoform X2 n=1 Tax=Portunus trituberculatus TaxID=210409 RepID=UPI001E1CEEDC|nr:syntaxin-7-like isoform X2 [Portunus trituberculatus]